MRGALEALSPERLPVPALRRCAWRVFYDVLARRFPQREWTFMNYGFVPERGEVSSARAAFEGLYARVVRPALPIDGADVVEVGAGRGGGARWLAEVCAARTVVALDIAPAAIALARSLHAGVPGLVFDRAPAHDLPCDDASADLVVSVESCHHYPSLDSFFVEAYRVLRPGGRLCLASYFPPAAVRRLRTAMVAAPLHVTEVEDLTAGVQRSVATTQDFKSSLIARYAPPAWRSLLRHFSGVQGSWIDRLVSEGRIVYLRAALVKAPS